MSSLSHSLRTGKSIVDGWSGVVLAAAAVLVAGCSSVSLDEPRPPRPPPREAPAPAALPPVLTPAPSEPAASAPSPQVEPPQTFPAPPSQMPAAPSGVPAPGAQPLAVPYGDAIASRFPDPGIRYGTPATSEGREQFTTQAELQDFLGGVATAGATGAGRAWLMKLGTSQNGSELQAVLLARGADPDAAVLLASGRPTVLLIGQQHGDEPTSAEALLAVLHELAAGRLAHLLENINVIVVPRANPDGALMGTRGTANGIDLNRDHLLLRTPEAQALARLVREYRPAVVVDVHEHPAVGSYLPKFGAVTRHDLLVQYAMTANLPAFIKRASEEWFRQPLVKSLRGQRLTTEWYHTTSDDINDRTVSMGSVRPETARNANGLKNSVSLLLEGRGSDLGRIHLQRRLHALVSGIESVLSSAAQRSEALRKLRDYVDAEVSSQACRGEMLIAARPARTEYQLTLIDAQTGADKVLTVDWNSALDLVPGKLRPRPCGYWLAADAGEAIMRLRTFGVAVQQLDLDARVQGDSYQRLPADGPAPQVGLIDALIDMPAGSYYVALTQPLANLVVAALEPDNPASYVANGLLPRVESVARIQAVPDLSSTLLP